LAQVRIEPAQGPTQAFGWGLSPTFRGKGVEQARVEIDSGALTVMTRFSGEPRDVEYLADDLTNLAHHLRPRARTHGLGVGGGRDVLAALAFGDLHVTGVEVNGVLLRALTVDFGDFTGHLERRPEVELVHDEARSFLARDD